MFACLCVSGEICGTLNCVGLLFRNVFALSQDVGVVSIAPWLGSISKCQCWVGEGLQHPALGNGFPWSGQEGCSSSFPPFLPSAPSSLAPPIKVVSDHLPYPLPLPGPSQASSSPSILACPLLPLPPRPQSILHGRPQCPPWLPSGPALMPCLFPSRWEQVLRVGSKPAQTRGLYNQQAALKVLCHALELPQ